MKLEDLFHRRNRDGVVLERTGARDLELSKRHRDWGFNLPAVDIDFLLVEYNTAKPAAIVDYKHYKAEAPDWKSANFRALIELADGYRTGIPFVIIRYKFDGPPENRQFSCAAYPVNQRADEAFKTGERFSEREWVARLHRIRRGWLDEEDYQTIQRLADQHDPEDPDLDWPRLW